MARSTAALLALVLALSAGTAEAAQSRIAVLQPDQELLRAVSLALSAWGLQTVPSDASFPSSTLPGAVQMASQLAQELDVDALVWVTRLEQGSLIWVFDAATGDVTVRRLPESLPFDSAAAAAVALSVKTALRTTAVAPPGERLVSRNVPPADEPEEVQSSPLNPRRRAALEVGAAGRWLTRDALALELHLAGSMWLLAQRNLGLSLGISWSPGLAIEDSGYRGRYRDSSAFGRACFRPIHTSMFSATVALGGALHFTTLEGTLTANAEESAARRVVASVDVEASVAASVTGPFYLGASAGAAYWPAHLRYLVAGRPIFAPSQLPASLGIFCGVALF
jgi:hypothetical protein